MSVRALAWVWQHSPKSGGQLLVLLALADFADDDGRAWPAVAVIAAKARLQVRQTQSVLRELTRDGEIAIEPRSGPGLVNTYRVLIGGANTAPPSHTVVQPDAPQPTTGAEPTNEDAGASGDAGEVQSSAGAADRMVQSSARSGATGRTTIRGNEPSGTVITPPEPAPAREGDDSPDDGPQGPEGTTAPMPFTWPEFVAILRTIPQWDSDDALDQKLITWAAAKLDKAGQREPEARGAYCTQVALALKDWWGDGTRRETKGRKPRDRYHNWFNRDLGGDHGQRTSRTPAGVARRVVGQRKGDPSRSGAAGGPRRWPGTT